jgi:AAA domain
MTQSQTRTFQGLWQRRPIGSLDDLAAAACDAARLVRDGTIGRTQAVDDLYRMAEGAGLVFRHGDDLVQAYISAGFRLIDLEPPQAAADIGQKIFGRKEKIPVASWHQRIFDAAALQTMTFPPLKFILPGIVPEGATLLVSRPKLGKSWLVLDIAIATAAERFTLGDLKPSPGDVLYLALEDGRRRLQRRVTRLLPSFSDSWPRPLSIATEWPRADQGGLADIEQWINSVKAPRLVIIDTLAQFRKVSNGRTPIYGDDYAAISDLQKLASKHNIGIIIVHHDRKAEAEDVFDTVSGSLGLTGAADTILIMKRRAGAVSLHVRGRDIEESEMVLQFEKSTCRWSNRGASAEFYRTAERRRVLAALNGVVGGLGIAEIMQAAELANRNAADQLLWKMVRDGDVVRIRRGVYGLPDGSGAEPGKIGKKGAMLN